jgi:hypothetical protein
MENSRLIIPTRWPSHRESRVVYAPRQNNRLLLNEMHQEATITSDWLLNSGMWQDDRWTMPLEDDEFHGIVFPLSYEPFQACLEPIWYYLTPKNKVLMVGSNDNFVRLDRVALHDDNSVIYEAIDLLRLTRGD